MPPSWTTWKSPSWIWRLINNLRCILILWKWVCYTLKILLDIKNDHIIETKHGTKCSFILYNSKYYKVVPRDCIQLGAPQSLHIHPISDIGKTKSLAQQSMYFVEASSIKSKKNNANMIQFGLQLEKSFHRNCKLPSQEHDILCAQAPSPNMYLMLKH